MLGFSFSQHPLLGLLILAVTALAAGHALMSKRDVRAAIGWTLWILALQGLGALTYWLFGVNRIRRRAVALLADRQRFLDAGERLRPEDLEALLGAEHAHLAQLALAVDCTVDAPLVAGNAVRPLMGGRQAFPTMLEAIEGAERSVGLMTYIFDHDPVGLAFVEALGEAVERGVEVRVLVDAVGERYSSPSICGALEAAGVRAVTFLGERLPWRWSYMNLRNHRKLLVVDGRLAFTGGMNIRQDCRDGTAGEPLMQDIHFEVVGPVVESLRQIFAKDWAFAAKETLRGEAWLPRLEARGEVPARAIADGPDEDYGNLRWTLLAALASARRSVRIMTPYFLPDQALITALTVADRRGIEVEVLLPERNNLLLVGWASTAQLWQVLEGGCRVYRTPPPFDHSKLMVVDGAWCLIGSTNWDPRSLRLNFELNLECYDRALGRQLEAILDEKKSFAREVTLAEVDSRPLPVRLRDSAARLLTPYL